MRSCRSQRGEQYGPSHGSGHNYTRQRYPGLAVNPISGDLYVSNASDNVIDVVKPGASKPFATIALGGEFPVGIATDPSTSPLYIAASNNEVTLADRVTKQLISTTTVGTTNSYLAISWSTGQSSSSKHVW